jgi:hypothetical protein
MKHINEMIDELFNFFNYSQDKQVNIINEHITRLAEVREILKEMEESKQFNTQGE